MKVTADYTETYQVWYWDGTGYDTLCSGTFDNIADAETHSWINGYDKYRIERTLWGNNVNYIDTSIVVEASKDDEL